MGRRPNKALTQGADAVRAALQLEIKAADIQNFGQKELLRLQSRVGLGEEWGVVEFPSEWMPPGVCRAHRILDLKKMMRLADLNDEDDGAIALVTIMRYALVCFFVPMAGQGSGAIVLAPTSLASAIKEACNIAKLALGCSQNRRGYIFARIDASCMATIRGRAKLRTELNRMLKLVQRGLWNDAPSGTGSDELLLQTEKPDGNDSPKSSPFPPLPDTFVGAVGWRAAWYVNEFEPVLLKCVADLVEAMQVPRIAGSSKHAHESRVSRLAKNYLAKYRWLDVSGKLITELPFKLNFSGAGNRETFCWPPKTLSHVQSLVALAQALHLVIFLLSTGGRISEALSLQLENLLRSAADGALVDGRTYKLEFSNDGAPRDWPLPDLAVRALVRQCEIRRLSTALSLEGVSKINGIAIEQPNLWASLRSGQEINSSYNNILESAVEILGLTEELAGSSIHAHRFRKTIARLIALAVVGAPKILMDLFGHNSIEMTILYILSDPDIRAEMEEVARAQVIMMAEEAIVDAENCGGPAAEPLRRAVRAERVRLGREFGEEDLQSLADTLTLSGTYWQLVRPGVICTKLPQQAGACNQRRGTPEPARCRSHCSVRLEMGALRDDVDRSIEEAVRHLQDCQIVDDVIGAEMWRGQIAANLNRFPDLKMKWSSHPAVSGALNS
ncbi:hypothetical protein R77569_00462 [Ralstonia mannitolilytica]|uniref:Tyr recombinase domain-containing protein n=1 Tax=Ralstonia mannitolilytica TaxID=105219 RepID=A0ABM9KF67_9RALS|nr:hypothetical protein R77569_00462 [Ralstonia mannitolilytica]